jgi:predicted transcriptional regulator with HTH domain
LNLVEQINSGKHSDIKLYRLTDFGKDIMNSLREHKRHF